MAVRHALVRVFVTIALPLIGVAVGGCKSTEPSETSDSSVQDSDAPFLPVGSPESLLVIVDLDDTVQIANAANKLRWIKEQRAFPGMPALLRLLGNKAEGRAYVVDARPRAQAPLAVEFLKKYGLANIVDAKQATFGDAAAAAKPRAAGPEGEPPVDPIFEFKKVRLEAILDRYVPSIALTSVAPAISRVVLIGDDTGVDADVYEHILDRYGERVRVEIYIRRVAGTTLVPRSFTVFSNALEIALNEFEQGTISATEAAAVGRAVLYKSCETNDRCSVSDDDVVADADLLPDFHSCPGALEPGGDLPEELETLRSQIAERMRRICEVREPAQAWQ